MKNLLLALAALLFVHASAAAVNLNTATKDDLVGLPGIGPAKAQAILDYRNQNGPFRAVEDVRKVKGIGEKLFLQIRPELVVTGGAPKPPAAAPAVAAAAKSADAKAAPPKPAAIGTVRDDKSNDKAKR